MPLSLILLDFRKPTGPWRLIKYVKQASEQMKWKPSSVLSLTLSSSGGFRLGWARIPQLDFSEWLWPSSFSSPRDAGGRKLARNLLLHCLNFTLKPLVRQVPVEGFVWELNASSILNELDFCHLLHCVNDLFSCLQSKGETTWYHGQVKGFWVWLPLCLCKPPE